MKIIEEKPWWIFNCKSCKSKLMAEPKDANFDLPDSDYKSLGARRYYVACVKCGYRHTIPDRKLTDVVLSFAHEPRL